MTAITKTTYLTVPKKGTSAASRIASRSAVVARQQGIDPTRITLDYEGAIYGAQMDFEAKIQHAASRAAENYPTVARLSTDRDDIVLCATLRHDEVLKGWVVVDYLDRDLLAAWAGEEPPLPGGSDAMHERAAARLMPTLQPARIAAIQMAAGKNAVRMCRMIVEAARGDKR